MAFVDNLAGKKSVHVLMTDMTISFKAVVVYSYLAYQDQFVKERGADPPSEEKIVKAVGLSVRSVRDAMRELAGLGLLDTDRQPVAPPSGFFRKKKLPAPASHWHHAYQYWRMPVRKPNDHISHLQWALLNYLYHCADAKFQPRTSASYLASVLHVGRTTIIDSVKKLEELGLLRTKPHAKGFAFTLNEGEQAMAFVRSQAQDEVVVPQNEGDDVIETDEWDIVDTVDDRKPLPSRYEIAQMIQRQGVPHHDYYAAAILASPNCEEQFERRILYAYNQHSWLNKVRKEEAFCQLFEIEKYQEPVVASEKPPEPRIVIPPDCSDDMREFYEDLAKIGDIPASPVLELDDAW